MNIQEREHIIARLAELDGGDEARRARSRASYSKFSDAALPSILESAEQAARDIARHGRLHAVWMDGGGEILVPAGEDDPLDAARQALRARYRAMFGENAMDGFSDFTQDPAEVDAIMLRALERNAPATADEIAWLERNAVSDAIY